MELVMSPSRFTLGEAFNLTLSEAANRIKPQSTKNTPWGPKVPPHVSPCGRQPWCSCVQLCVLRGGAEGDVQVELAAFTQSYRLSFRVILETGTCLCTDNKKFHV